MSLTFVLYNMQYQNYSNYNQSTFRKTVYIIKEHLIYYKYCLYQSSELDKYIELQIAKIDFVYIIFDVIILWVHTLYIFVISKLNTLVIMERCANIFLK